MYTENPSVHEKAKMHPKIWFFVYTEMYLLIRYEEAISLQSKIVWMWVYHHFCSQDLGASWFSFFSLFFPKVWDVTHFSLCLNLNLERLQIIFFNPGEVEKKNPFFVLKHLITKLLQSPGIGIHI